MRRNWWMRLAIGALGVAVMSAPLIGKTGIGKTGIVAATPDIAVTLLGSGGGSNPNPKRFGPSILVQAGPQTLLFDCGRGATIRLAQLGDTRFSENLIKFARGVDVLIHEAIDPTEVRARLTKLRTSHAEIDNIVAHHITAEEAGIVFSRVKPRLAVYAHISDADLITLARKAYAGPLEAGEDLMTIDRRSRVGASDEVTACGREVSRATDS